jgi:type I restriction enzyme R subunit
MDQEVIRRRHLPHWDVPDAAYFVTTCLAGSVPARGLLDLQAHRAELEQRDTPAGKSKDQWQTDKWKLHFVRIEHWLDQEPVNRALADERLARAVVDSLFYFAGVRYDLIAFVVMPSHVHWLFQPIKEWVATLPDKIPTARERIMYSVKRYTANCCNSLSGKRGQFWQDESYDHWVRDVEEMERIILYIENNPVKAGLVNAPEKWPFSSAAVRARWGLEFGCPLLKEHWLSS